MTWNIDKFKAYYNAYNAMLHVNENDDVTTKVVLVAQLL